MSERARQDQPAASRSGADDRPVKPPPPMQGGRPAGVTEHGGPKGPEPTRYGDWEKGGRCTDF